MTNAVWHHEDLANSPLIALGAYPIEDAAQAQQQAEEMGEYQMRIGVRIWTWMEACMKISGRQTMSGMIVVTFSGLAMTRTKKGTWLTGPNKAYTLPLLPSSLSA
jgi:hypothetical protein